MLDINVLITMPVEELEQEVKIREEILLGGDKSILELELSEKFKDIDIRTLLKAIKIIKLDPLGTIGDVDVENELSRKPIQQQPLTLLEKNAAAVPLICSENFIRRIDDNFSMLSVDSLEYVYGFCKNALKTPNNNNFLYDPSNSGFFTGILYDSNIVLTNSHCIPQGIDVQTLRVVFGYQMDSNNSWPGKTPNTPYQFIVSNENIFTPVREIKRSENFPYDWVLLELDCPTDRTPPTKSNSNITSSTELYSLGYPFGLPLKNAHNGKVISLSSLIFMASLDIYSGNSGSPVFNKETHELEGLIVDTDTRLIQNSKENGCFIPIQHPENKGYGATCIKISAII